MSTVERTERRPIMARVTDPWPRLVDWFEAMVPTDPAWRAAFTHSLRVEEFSRDGTFVVRAELPGIDPAKDVDITVSEGLLTIEGTREERVEEGTRSEFFYGRFMRTIGLPAGVDDKDIKASYRDGILEIEISVPERRPAAVHVPVTRVEPRP